MMRTLLVGLGAIVALAGVVFTLQGVGAIGGSAMSGVTFWAVAGPVIVLAGHCPGFRRAAPPLRVLTSLRTAGFRWPRGGGTAARSNSGFRPRRSPECNRSLSACTRQRAWVSTPSRPAHAEWSLNTGNRGPR